MEMSYEIIHRRKKTQRQKNSSVPTEKSRKPRQRGGGVFSRSQEKSPYASLLLRLDEIPHIKNQELEMFSAQPMAGILKLWATSYFGCP